MLMSNLKPLLTELLHGLTRLYGSRMKGLTLYGSQARGEAVEGSDIDMALVLDDFSSAGEEISRFSELAAGLSLKYGCVVSLIPIRERDWLTRQTPLLMNIRREGIPLNSLS
jgi:predicted nucleotidyltransferase